MKKSRFILLVVVIFLVINVAFFLIAGLFPKDRFEMKPLIEFNTTIKTPASIINYLTLDKNHFLVADTGKKRIMEYENGTFKRLLLADEIKNYENLSAASTLKTTSISGDIRGFTTVGNKVYVSTQDRLFFVFDPINNEYAFPGFLNAETIAENKDEVIYMFSFDKTLVRVDEDKEVVFEGDIPTELSCLKVDNGYIYALSEEKNKILKINEDFAKKEVLTFFSQPVENHIVSFDIDNESVYVISYDYFLNKNRLMILDMNGNIKMQKLSETKIDIGMLEYFDGKISVVWDKTNTVYRFSKDLEFVDEFKNIPVPDTSGVISPSEILPFKNGLLIAVKSLNSIVYAECEANYTNCKITNSVKTSDPRLMSTYGDMICTGRMMNGIECYDLDLKPIKEIIFYKDEFLSKPRSVLLDEKNLFVAESDNGCIYKFTREFEPVDKVCGFTEVTRLIKVKNLIIASDVQPNTLYFINPDTLKLVYSIELLSTLPRGLAYLNDALYMAHLEEGIFKKTNVFDESGNLITIDRNWVFDWKKIDDVPYCKGMGYNSERFFISDGNKIRIYYNDVLEKTIQIPLPEEK